MCRDAGINPPEYAEITGAAVVTFRAPVGSAARQEAKVESKVASGFSMPARNVSKSPAIGFGEVSVS